MRHWVSIVFARVTLTLWFYFIIYFTWALALDRSVHYISMGLRAPSTTLMMSQTLNETKKPKRNYAQVLAVNRILTDEIRNMRDTCLRLIHCYSAYGFFEMILIILFYGINARRSKRSIHTEAEMRFWPMNLFAQLTLNCGKIPCKCVEMFLAFESQASLMTMSQCRRGYQKIQLFAFHTSDCDHSSFAVCLQPAAAAATSTCAVFVAICWHFLFGYNLYRIQFFEGFFVRIQYECRCCWRFVSFRFVWCMLPLCIYILYRSKIEQSSHITQTEFDCISKGFTNERERERERARERERKNTKPVSKPTAKAFGSFASVFAALICFLIDKIHNEIYRVVRCARE